jgi:hypothetical protein
MQIGKVGEKHNNFEDKIVDGQKEWVKEWMSMHDCMNKSVNYVDWMKNVVIKGGRKWALKQVLGIMMQGVIKCHLIICEWYT